MSLGPEVLRWMDQRALALAEQLRRYKTPGTGEPVSPSVVGPLYRTARVAASLAELEQVLRLFPSSAQARRTGSSAPQAQFFNDQLGRLVAEVRAGTAAGRWSAAEEARVLAAVLGHAMRALKGPR